ncbi:unnamed protein product [Musa textilis]
MDHGAQVAEPEGTGKAFSFPNGALRKHHQRSPPVVEEFLYRECLKNHAASLGGHALDGCGEFMLSPAADPADPSSIRCAACGCHRNFHRRLPGPLHHRHRSNDQEGGGGEDGDGEDDEEAEMDGGRVHRWPRLSSTSPPLFYPSAPHMLLALSAGLPVAAPIAAVAAPPAAAESAQPRKRFRTSSPRSRRTGCRSCRSGWGGGCRRGTRCWWRSAAGRSASTRASSKCGCTTTSIPSSAKQGEARPVAGKEAAAELSATTMSVGSRRAARAPTASKMEVVAMATR